MSTEEARVGGGIEDILIDPEAQNHLASSQARATHGSRASQTPDKTTVLAVLEHTDTGNARLCAQLADGRYRYNKPWKKWLWFDGKRWRIDSTGRALALTKTVAEHLIAEGLDAKARGEGDDLIDWGQKSASEPRRKAMLGLAECEQGIPIEPSDLNGDPNLLNCFNGTLDLKNQRLRRHSRDDLLTKLVLTRFARRSKAPVWEEFLRKVLPDEATRAFVQRLVGYSLTGDQSEQIVTFLVGEGANGKTTFLNAISGTIGGDYAIQVSSEVLLKRFQRGHPTEIADLFGVRIAMCVETGQQADLDEVLIKSLTGGDKLRARRMREDFWEFTPTHHIWVATNHRPSVQGNDHAIWRRIVVIPFGVTFLPADQDHDLAAKLRAEAPGILAWAVRGLVAWRKDGLQIPESVRQNVAEYRQEMDVIGQSLEDLCECGDLDASVGATMLYVGYSAWCRTHGEQPLPQRLFGPEMVRRGFERRKRNGLKIYLGLKFWPGVGLDPVQGPWGLPGGNTPIARARAHIEGNEVSGPHGPQGPQSSDATLAEPSCRAGDQAIDPPSSEPFADFETGATAIAIPGAFEPERHQDGAAQSAGQVECATVGEVQPASECTDASSKKSASSRLDSIAEASTLSDGPPLHRCSDGRTFAPGELTYLGNSIHVTTAGERVRVIPQ